MASGSFESSYISGHYKLRVDWTSTANASTNSSSVTVKAYFVNDWDISFSSSKSGTIVIDGSTYSFSVSPFSGTGSHLLSTKSKTVTHDADGKKSITISATFNANAPISGHGTLGTMSASKTVALDTIPRYATVTQSVQSKTETTITMKWVSDSTIDRIQYSTNNGDSWSAATTVNASSGTYTISGLTANNPYKIKTRVRNKASQLSTDSSALSVSTYNWPYCSSMPDFTIESKLTLKFYNPLGRTMTVSLLDKNGTLVGTTNTVTGTTLSGFTGAAYTSDLYDSIPNDRSATYSVKVAITSPSSHTTTKTGGTYSVDEYLCQPTIGSVAYFDSNKSTITGNDQVVIQGQSAVMFTASNLVAKNKATIAQAYINFTGKAASSLMTLTTAPDDTVNAVSSQAYTIGELNNVQAIVTVYDSRGIYNHKAVPVTVVQYSAPSASISAYRENGYYSTSYLTANATFAPINVGGVDKNSISMTYAIQQDGSSSWSAETSITSGVQAQFTADNTTAWTIRVKVTDRIQTVFVYFVLPKGMPLIFFDRKQNSVGINCFPQHDNAFEVVPLSGTYNPAIAWGTSGGSGSPTLTNKTFYYAVTGNVMQISGVFQITAMGNSGNASLRIDLPAGYTCATGSSSNSAPVGMLNPVTPASRPLIACARGSDYLYVVGGASAGSASSYMSTGYYMLSAMLIVNVT